MLYNQHFTLSFFWGMEFFLATHPMGGSRNRGAFYRLALLPRLYEL